MRIVARVPSIDNSASERALRAVAVGRKNWMFAGSDAGGERAAGVYTLNQTAKRNGVEPFAYLRDLFVRFAKDQDRRANRDCGAHLNQDLLDGSFRRRFHLELEVLSKIL